MRIFYKATSFAEDKEVTVFFIKPDLTQSETFTLIHWGEGIYYIDVDLSEDEPYCGKFFEDGVGKTIKLFSKKPLGAVSYHVRGATIVEI